MTESLDGGQVAPLMGDYTDAADVGTLRIRMLPNFWNHSKLRPQRGRAAHAQGPVHTQIRMTWLVDEKAEEGRDYDLDKLLPFWLYTAEQDWADLRENQQARRDSNGLHARSSLHLQGVQPRPVPAVVREPDARGGWIASSVPRPDTAANQSDLSEVIFS